MKLSDYVIQFLENQNVEDVFLLAGGGIMHLLDSLAKSHKINKFYNLHEQASGFAADGYAQYGNKLGVVFATTGPGATNVVTSLASAYIDSTPMLVISGQVKRADITSIEGVRQTGAQEAGIIPIVNTITKYAITVMNPEDIRYILEKAFYEAKNDRPGTVWVDIPLDIQAADIEPNNLHGFEPEEIDHSISDEDMEYIYNSLLTAKRPCIFAGTGIILSGARNEFVEMVNKLQIPVVTSRRVRRLFRKGDDRYFFGSAGMVAPRYANYVLQNSDCAIVLGSGLRYYNTCYNEGHFAPLAKKIIINIHSVEISKLRMDVDKGIVCDVGSFIRRFSSYCNGKGSFIREKWLSYCDKMKALYPAVNEIPKHNDGLSDGYRVAEYINKYARNDDIYVASPSAFAYGYNIYELRGNQDYVCPIGLRSMGTALPFAIGVCIAAKHKRVILGEGDGSLQHNIQELALLKEYDLPIKIFIDNNHMYRQIFTMQNTHFAGRLAGCNQESGLAMPDLESIAMAYGLKYYRIDSMEDTEAIVQAALEDDEPVLVDIISSSEVEYVPITKSRVGADGKMISSKMEDLYPFLPIEEQERNMNLWKEYEDESTFTRR